MPPILKRGAGDRPSRSTSDKKITKQSQFLISLLQTMAYGRLPIRGHLARRPPHPAARPMGQRSEPLALLLGQDQRLFGRPVRI